MRQKFFDLIPQRQLFKGLAMVVVLILAAGVNTVLLVDLNLRSNAEAAKNREFGIWAVFQLDREVNLTTAMFQVQAASEGKYSVYDLSERYEILYSRINTLGGAEYRINFQSDPSLSAAFTAVRDIVYSYADIVDAWYAAKEINQAELVAIAEQLGELRGMSLELLVATNQALAKLQTAEAVGIHTRIFWSTIGITFTFVLIIGLLIFLLFVLRDLGVSNQKAQQAAKAAEAGDRAKTSFLATMSHEIRTPLNGILGMIDVLDRSNLTPEQQRQLAIAQRSGDALLHIITDILDMSKLEANAVEIQTASFRLAELIDSTIVLVSPEANKKGLDIQSNIDDVCIDADQARLRQVLFNLMGNAVKFTAAGSVSLSAKFKSTIGSRGILRFEVRDTGIGISAQGMTHLFKEFSQVDGSISRRYGGTGLGLAISKKLVTVMGGEIGVDSTPGEGSVFWFTVPVELAEQAFHSPVEALTASSENLSMHVLLVEDNDTNRDVALAMLTQLGITADVATDGNLAIARTKERSYDVIFMDMQMPNMDGLEATRVLRSMEYRAPIVGLTGNASVDDRDACMNAGMNDYLSKPITRAKMREMLDRWSPERAGDTPSEVDPSFAEVDAAQQSLLRRELGDDGFLRSIDTFVAEASAIIDRLSNPDVSADAVVAELKSLRSLARGVGYKGFARMVRTIEVSYPESGSLDLVRLQKHLEAQPAAA